MAVDGSHRGQARGGLARTALIFVLIGALAAPQAGCSFLFVQKPPPAESRRGGVVDCTSANVAPVLDGLVMGFQMVRTGLAMGATDSQYQGAPIDRSADIMFGIGLTTLFAASMIAGFGWTSDCREAIADESYPASRPGPRPRSGASTRPALRVGPPPPSQRRQEDEEEEAAVQARSAERARAEAVEAAAAAEAASHTAAPAAPPAKAPAVPQRNDTE